jgi:hypothetical protein
MKSIFLYEITSKPIIKMLKLVFEYLFYLLNYVLLIQFIQMYLSITIEVNFQV